MAERLIEVDRKQLVRFRNTLKRMLGIVGKFGQKKITVAILNKPGGKEKVEIMIPMKIFFIIDVDTHEVHPIVSVSHGENPYGGMFCPARLYLRPTSLDNSINIMDLDSVDRTKYYVTDIYTVDVPNFRPYITALKELTLTMTDEGFIEPNLEFITKTETGYLTELRGFESIQAITDMDEDFIDIDLQPDADEFRRALVLDGVYTHHYGDGLNIKLYNSVSPAKFDKISFRRCNPIRDEVLTAVVECKQIIKEVEVRNFYTYVDIWNKNAKKGETVV